MRLRCFTSSTYLSMSSRLDLDRLVATSRLEQLVGDERVERLRRRLGSSRALRSSRVALHLVRGDRLAVDRGDDPVHHLGAAVPAAESATTIATAASNSGRPCLMAGVRVSRRSAALQGRTMQRLADGAHLGDHPVVIRRRRPYRQRGAAGQAQASLRYRARSPAGSPPATGVSAWNSSTIASPRRRAAVTRRSFSQRRSSITSRSVSTSGGIGPKRSTSSSRDRVADRARRGCRRAACRAPGAGSRRGRRSRG